MESSPHNQGDSVPPDRNLSNPPFHQRYAQQTSGGQPTQSFVGGPGFPSVLGPVLPPNLTAMPQMPQQQFPRQQSSPPLHMYGPPRSHLPEDQVFRQIFFARAIKEQTLEQVQHHHHQHPNPLSQLQHLQSSQYYPQTNSQYQSQLPNFGPQVAFTAHPAAHFGLQAAPPPSHNPQNGLSKSGPHLSQFALRTFRDMHEQSPADFVYGIRRPHSTSNLQIFHSQPHHQVQSGSQEPSGTFQPQNTSVMAGSRRKKPSRGTNATPSAERTKNSTSGRGRDDETASQSMTLSGSKDTTKNEHLPERNASPPAQRPADGAVSQSMRPTDPKDTIKSSHSPETNASPLAQIRRRLVGQSGSSQGNQRRNKTTLLGNGSSGGVTHVLKPTAAKSPQDKTMTGMNEDSGYISRHEPLGKDVPAPDATAHMLDAATASLEEQIQSAALLPFTTTPAHQFSDFQIAHCVPFMKVTRSTRLTYADNVSSLAGDPLFLEDEDQSDRPGHVSHPYNRYITWQQFGQRDHESENPYAPYSIWPNMFCNYLNAIRDTETLSKLPNGGSEDQYLSEPPQQPDTSVWVAQVTGLANNADLWLPVPLIQLFGLFDIPYGIGIEFPDSVKATIRPNRHAEFTESEATTLMKISMQRLRTGYLIQPQKPWNVYTARFMDRWGWSPTVERMRVLDLMFLVDLVYYFQGCGGPLHWFSIYNQNQQRQL